ncbi:hypothetical protein VNO77_27447 [Canavalia gladiata]|uniref:Uncharacterized protein n=1 Tax=Canavalia gladiata TaxID=3824 RepID=A0AAN9Q463_CANGL
MQLRRNHMEKAKGTSMQGGEVRYAFIVERSDTPLTYAIKSTNILLPQNSKGLIGIMESTSVKLEFWEVQGLNYNIEECRDQIAILRSMVLHGSNMAWLCYFQWSDERDVGTLSSWACLFLYDFHCSITTSHPLLRASTARSTSTFEHTFPVVDHNGVLLLTYHMTACLSTGFRRLLVSCTKLTIMHGPPWERLILNSRERTQETTLLNFLQCGPLHYLIPINNIDAIDLREHAAQNRVLEMMRWGKYPAFGPFLSLFLTWDMLSFDFTLPCQCMRGNVPQSSSVHDHTTIFNRTPWEAYDLHMKAKVAKGSLVMEWSCKEISA